MPADDNTGSREAMQTLAAARKMLDRRNLTPRFRKTIRDVCNEVMRFRLPVAVHAEALVVFVASFKGAQNSILALEEAARAEELAHEAGDPKLAFEALCLWVHCGGTYVGSEEHRGRLDEIWKLAHNAPQSWRQWAEGLAAEVADFCESVD